MHTSLSGRSLAVALMLVCSGVSAAPLPAMNPEWEAVGRDIDAEIAAGRLTGVAVALVKDGRIVWEAGYGDADREAGRKATSHTPFSIASTTKPFTTTAMMTLAAAGKLQLDRPANDYLGPEKIVDDHGPVAAATVRRLASHTSGLPTFFTMYPDGIGKPSVPELLRTYGHVFGPPGERYEYSNLAMTTLAYIVERQSGQDFADYLAAHVFAPLGMRDSFYGTTLDRVRTGAVRYDVEGKPLPLYLTGSPGSGEVFASAHDLALFAMLHLKDSVPGGRRILTPAQLDELHRPLVDTLMPGVRYGMGWEIWSMPDGLQVLSHRGGQVGVSSEFWLVPGSDAAVIVLSNRRNAHHFEDQVRDRLLRTVVPQWKGLPKSTPAPVARPEPAASYAGTWRGRLLVAGQWRPTVMVVAPDAASATLSVDGSEAKPLADFGVSNGVLQGSAPIRLDAPDEKRFDVSEMEVALTLRGAAMDGELVTYKITPRQMTILPHRIVLAR